MTTTEKTCFKCHATKPITEFYAHPQMADGHLNKCKSCTKVDVSKNYRRNIDRFRMYERGRAMLTHRVEMRAKYRQTASGKCAVKRAERHYREAHPMKYIAHTMVCNAIRDGKLMRMSCEVCGSEKAQAHHDDYTKPLDVRWLCTKHHAEHHRRMRETRQRVSEHANPINAG